MVEDAWLLLPEGQPKLLFPKIDTMPKHSGIQITTEMEWQVSLLSNIQSNKNC